MFADGGCFMGGMHLLWWMFWLLVVGGIAYYLWGVRGRSAGAAH